MKTGIETVVALANTATLGRRTSGGEKQSVQAPRKGDNELDPQRLETDYQAVPACRRKYHGALNRGRMHLK